MPDQIREVTRSLLESICTGRPVTPAAIVDFGLEAPDHYSALAYGVEMGDIDAQTLDAALGNGPELTALVNGIEDNPYGGVVYHTSWDVIFGRDGAGEREIEIEPPEEELDRNEY